MNSERTEAFTPDEVFDNWNSMDKDDKIKVFTDPSSTTIAALTEFVKAFDKSNEMVFGLRQSRNDVLIELLKKGDWSIDEIERIVTLMDKGIKEADESKDKGNNLKIKALVIVGGIASIAAGVYVATKGNKKTGAAMMTAGTAALLGVAGGETKIVKALIDSFKDTQNEEIVEA